MNPESIMPFIYITTAPKKMQCPIEITHILHFTPTAISLIGQYYIENELDEDFDPLIELYDESGELIEGEEMEVEIDLDEDELPQGLEDMIMEQIFIIQAICFCKKILGENKKYVADESLLAYSDEPLAIGVVEQNT